MTKEGSSATKKNSPMALGCSPKTKEHFRMIEEGSSATKEHSSMAKGCSPMIKEHYKMTWAKPFNNEESPFKQKNGFLAALHKKTYI